MCLQVPVSFVYGETDWMDPKAGVRVAASVQQSRGALSSTDCQVCHNSETEVSRCVHRTATQEGYRACEGGCGQQHRSPVHMHMRRQP